MPRSRLNEERCDYCYYERSARGVMAKERRELMKEAECICSPEVGCRSTLCAYGRSIGGVGGSTGSVWGNRKVSNG